MSFKLRTYPGHPTIRHSEDGGESWSDTEFCGHSHCDGACGLPALVIRVTIDGRERELKAHSSMVAAGPVWQDKQRIWKGETVEPPAHLDRERLRKLWWS